jgi:hypothetical protein
MASLSTRKKAPQKPASAEDSSAFGPIAERFRRAGDLDRAISLCREGLRKFPDHISARVTLGWALLEQGKYDDAREELEQVLRRRPDNLAAIRALAELHDRAEHTMNLPMDGPGQWPPSDDAVDQAATPTVTDELLAVDPAEEPVLLVSGHGHVAGYTPAAAVMTPPDMGLAMWSPAPEPEPADTASNEMTAVEEPSVVEPMLASEPAAATSLGVSEADIAALIAEAESLEAAAESQNLSSAAMLDTDVDLGAVDLSALVHPVENPAAVDVPQAVAHSVAFVPSETGTVEPFEAAAPEEFFAEAPAPSAQASEPTHVEARATEQSEAVAAETLEAAAVEPFEAMAAPEPFEAVAAESSAVMAAEPFEPVESAEADGDVFALVAPEPFDPIVEVEIEAEAAELRPDPELQPELRFDLPEVIEQADVAEPVEIAPVAAASVVRLVPHAAVVPAVIALERFLAKVQVRRTQLMAESVA